MSTPAGPVAYEIAIEDRAGVRLLSLDRPGKLNSFTSAGYRLLRTYLDDAAASPDVRVVVITGRGRAFCAGADLDEAADPDGSEALFAAAAPLLTTLANFPKPLIGAVNGLAVGYGASLLLHCDIVFMDEAAWIQMPFVKLRTCAEAASSWLLPRCVGPQTAAWMILGGSRMTAQESVAAGLALAAAPTGTVLDEAIARADVIATGDVVSLMANKALLRAGWAPQIEETWLREQAAIAATAEALGPMGR